MEEITSKNSWLKLEDWIEVPNNFPVDERGSNILHFNTKNRPYSRSNTASLFAGEMIAGGAAELDSDVSVLLHSVQMAKAINSAEKNEGIYLEFGVCSGRTINFIAALAYDKSVFGFDSGLGLPKYWRQNHPKGQFKLKESGKFPFCPLDNTTLIVGNIEDTLPEFVESRLNRERFNVDFIHIDTDVDDVANCILNTLKPYIRRGKTIIVLDEGYNYRDTEKPKDDDCWKKHEYQAIVTFARINKFDIKYLSFNKNLQQISLMLT